MNTEYFKTCQTFVTLLYLFQFKSIMHMYSVNWTNRNLSTRGGFKPLKKLICQYSNYWAPLPSLVVFKNLLHFLFINELHSTGIQRNPYKEAVVLHLVTWYIENEVKWWWLKHYAFNPWNSVCLSLLCKTDLLFGSLLSLVELIIYRLEPVGKITRPLHQTANVWPLYSIWLVGIT